MDSLIDGTGKGYRARVTSDNQLEVYAESVPAEGLRSQAGEAFVIHGRCHTKAASSGAFFYIRNNDPNHNMVVTRIYIDPFIITPTKLICTQVFDAIPVGGTNVSTSAVVQKNRGSANLFDLTVYQSDGAADLTFTGGTEYHSFMITSGRSTERNMNETNIVPSGRSITWGWEVLDGTNAVDGEIVSFSVNVIKRKLSV